MRGTLLRQWEPAGPPGADERRRWLVAAERIATGIVELAHLDVFVDAEALRVGFSCDGDAALAAAYEEAIRRENIEARRVAAAIAGRGDDPGRPLDEVTLPCSPFASDEEITHAVLATMKASHALEFGIVLAEDEAVVGRGPWAVGRKAESGLQAKR
ncbi:MAG: hypothetical protein AVDCRST_MAG88-2225 [uncultured Thermomicrobiales bacterium]|uniref:Uncharacterized protein n=1 Tax=uncultured Thermomicrobiales bacterium TaxID=1645740 RepID=A0A6J4V683_9BACT|nr:MAG: hypothetical protein AVDCRST_MAG88-2225 [uncultured Thermomicrobiales bacterium]